MAIWPFPYTIRCFSYLTVYTLIFIVYALGPSPVLPDDGSQSLMFAVFEVSKTVQCRS